MTLEDQLRNVRPALDRAIDDAATLAAPTAVSWRSIPHSRVRAVAAGLLAVAIIAAAIGVALARADSDPKPATTTGRSVGDRFVPHATVEHGRVVLPVTLPDGERFTVRYPATLRIAELGFAGSANVYFGGEQGSTSCCSSVSVSYQTIAQAYGDAKPIKQYPNRQGASVPLFRDDHRLGSIEYPVGVLAFQFGPWLVRVSNPSSSRPPMTDQQLAALARGLTATIDDHGYPVLHADAPLTISSWFQGGFGTDGHGNSLTFDAQYCAQSTGYTSKPTRADNGTRAGLAWCDGDMLVNASGSSAFVDLVERELRVSPVAPPTAGPSGTKALGKPTAATPAFVRSATFISPDRGWALVENGCSGAVCKLHVVRTLNGGRTWKQIGDTEPIPTAAARVRFADASHGFVFAPFASPVTPLLATDDGGAHWKPMDTPFSNISDLAVSRGVVYVVGVPRVAATGGAFPGYRVWSSPAARINWVADPLAIRAGAGPVSTQQLVLAGDRGWIVNLDRSGLSGEQLSPSTGRWSEWTPPCRDVNGYAQLAASSSSDLVAVCAPGIGTASAKSYIEFSHDSGATFERRILPDGRFGAAGPVTPELNTAVIKQNISLLRTTDAGRTWQVVTHDDTLIGERDTVTDVSIIDSGFTTTRQGFAVLDSGLLLMTYDAGATWDLATLSAPSGI